MEDKERKLYLELLAHAKDKKPVQVEKVFHKIMSGKIKQIIKQKQSEIMDNLDNKETN